MMLILKLVCEHGPIHDASCIERRLWGKAMLVSGHGVGENEYDEADLSRNSL